MSTVVLCGSLGATSAMWEPQLPVLGEHHVVSVEHPGHGEAPVVAVSDVRDLARRVLDQVDGPFSFVGLSLGGLVGMQLAIDAPDRVNRLVLACTSAQFGDPQQWLDRAAVVRSDGLEAIVDAVLGRWFVEAPADLERYRAMFLSVEAEGYARCCEALAVSDARGSLAAISAPTLLIAGAEDPTSTPAEMAEIARAIPGARLEVIGGAAHLANVEGAETFNRLLKEHL